MALPISLLNLIAQSKSVCIVTDNALAPPEPVSISVNRVLHERQNLSSTAAPSCRWSSSSPLPCRWKSSSGKSNSKTLRSFPAARLKARRICATSLPRKPERIATSPEKKLSPVESMSIHSLCKVETMILQDGKSPLSPLQRSRNSTRNSVSILSEALATAISFAD